MEAAVRTDTGRRRRRNEDAYVCEPPLFAIADGMGGAQAGEVASGLAAAVLAEPGGEERGAERVRALIEEANRRVFRRSSEDAAVSGMGTTMTVALVDPDAATIVLGHVGDSRAYRIRQGELEQLTDDHSLVGELTRSGKLSREEAETHPQRSVITRAVGTEPDVDVDVETIPFEPGDIFLLCSDGLTDMVSDGEILALVDGSSGLDDAARALVTAANRGGGEDNITVVLFRPDGTAEEAALDDDEDTLSGLDPVPVVEAPPAAAEPEAADTGRRIFPLLLLAVLVLAIATLALWGLTR
jgi:protein phosphatase